MVVRRLVLECKGLGGGVVVVRSLVLECKWLGAGVVVVRSLLLRCKGLGGGDGGSKKFGVGMYVVGWWCGCSKKLAVEM